MPSISTPTVKILALGASRNIGYFAALRLLEAGGVRITFLLRRPKCFDEDTVMQTHIKEGHAIIVDGDASVEEDMRRAWVEAAKGDGQQIVNWCLCTIGAKPTDASFSLTKGVVFNNGPGLITQCTLNILSTMPSKETRLVIITSLGTTKESHRALPALYKPMYGWALRGPHEDKLGVERAISHCADTTQGDLVWSNPEVPDEIMGKDWKSGRPLPQNYTNVVIVRPALLFDSACKAERNCGRPNGLNAYRIVNGQSDQFSSYSISRKDVAHFIVEGVVKDWETYKGHIVAVGY